MKSTNVLKKEYIDEKEERVFQELDGILNSGETPSTLTEDQRFILTNLYGKSLHKCFDFKGKESVDYERRCDDSCDDCVFSNLNDYKNMFTHLLSTAILEAQKWIDKNDLVYINCGLGAFDVFEVSGYVSISDNQLIEKYTKAFKAKQKAKQKQEKIRKEEEKKIITVNNKKYKLIEEFSCDCECGCDCWNGHCDCGCGECT